jgi:hypothetical protein
MVMDEVGGAAVTELAQWISPRSWSSASRMSCCALKRFVMSTSAVDAETKSCVSAARTMPMISSTTSISLSE